jgi:hypothetical protein
MMPNVFVQRRAFGQHHAAGQDTDGKRVEAGADPSVPLIALGEGESRVRMRKKSSASKMAGNLHE